MCRLAGGKIWGYPPAIGPEQSQFSAFCVYSAEGGARRTQPSSFGSTHAHFAAKAMVPPRSMEATHRGLVIYGGVGHPPDLQTIEGQDHEESRFWKQGVGCIRYTATFKTFILYTFMCKCIDQCIAGGWDVSDIRPPLPV